MRPPVSTTCACRAPKLMQPFQGRTTGIVTASRTDCPVVFSKIAIITKCSDVNPMLLIIRMAHRGEHTIRSSVILSGFSPASVASVKKPPIDITQLDRCLAFYKEIPLIHEDRSICQHFLQFPSNHWPFLLFDQQRLRSVITYHKNCSSLIKTGTIFGLVLLPAASESALGVGILQ